MYGDDDDDDLLNSNDLLQSVMIDGDRIIICHMCVCVCEVVIFAFFVCVCVCVTKPNLK